MFELITKDADKEQRYWVKLWQMDWPLKDLTNNEEYERDGQRHPQVAGFGVYSSIPILQVSPAQALRKPQPLLPEPLTQLREHPATQDTQAVSTRFISLLGCKASDSKPKTHMMKRKNPHPKKTKNLYMVPPKIWMHKQSLGANFKDICFTGLAMYMGRHLWLGMFASM